MKIVVRFDGRGSFVNTGVSSLQIWEKRPIEGSIGEAENCAGVDKLALPSI